MSWQVSVHKYKYSQDSRRVTRMTDSSNCRVVVADYVFLGLPRLACEVK